MPTPALARKQKDFLKEVLSGQYRMLMAAGSVRSGKSFSAAAGFYAHMQRYTNANFILAGYTTYTVIRNVVPYLEQFAEMDGITCRRFRDSNGEGIRIGQNRVYIYGGSNEASDQAIQGLTAAGALFDEAVNIHPNFIVQALMRLSVVGAIAIFTLNPGHPGAWFKREYIDKLAERRGILIQFQLEDNPTLTEDTMRDLRASASGHLYKRLIEGEWAAATGAIFPNVMIIPEDEIDYTQYSELDIGADYGMSNPTAGAFIAKKRPPRLDNLDLSVMSIASNFYRWDIIDEYYSAPDLDGEKSVRQHANDMMTQAQELSVKYRIPLGRIFIDPSATALILELREMGIMPVVSKRARLNPDAAGSNKEVLARIQLLERALEMGVVQVSSKCARWIEEQMGYVWDEKAAERNGLDKPLKRNDHLMDGTGYWAAYSLPAVLPRISAPASDARATTNNPIQYLTGVAAELEERFHSEEFEYAQNVANTSGNPRQVPMGDLATADAWNV